MYRLIKLGNFGKYGRFCDFLNILLSREKCVMVESVRCTTAKMMFDIYLLKFIHLSNFILLIINDLKYENSLMIKISNGKLSIREILKFHANAF